ncbi:toprim domain-containing protein [Novipirellula sp.]|uniref:toprim domain-containing protein n=1 Tax=Novipirellula sp. TaxID=2795430 RepID=UPI003566152B
MAACRWLAEWHGLAGKPSKRLEPRPVVGSIRLDRVPSPTPDAFNELATRCHSKMKPAWFVRLADRLNLPAETLAQLRVGWYAEKNATTWPMVDAKGLVIGIRLRCLETNRKWSVRGGRAGLFVPVGLPKCPDRLFVCEGPTDTAAVLSMGLPVIGRASCTGSVVMECETVRRFKPCECVVIADRDDAGRRGAESLAVGLLTCCRSVRVIVPPEPWGDVREWIARGGTATDITAAVETAKPRCLTINSGVTS